MKQWCIIFLILGPLIGLGQTPYLDSLRRELAQARSDTSRVLVLAQLAQSYGFYSADSSEQVGQRALLLARKLQFRKGEGRALNSIAHSLRDNGEFPQALAYNFQAVQLAQSTQDKLGEAHALFNTVLIYSALEQYKRALDYHRKAGTIYRALSDQAGIVVTLSNRNGLYRALNQPDSIKWVIANVKRLILSPSYKPREPSSLVLISLILYQGRLEERQGNARGSLSYFSKALALAYADHNIRNQCQVQYNLADLFDRLHQTDSSLHYARLALGNTRYVLKNYELRAANLLAKLYAGKGQLDSAYVYQKRAQVANDHFFGTKKFQELQLLLLAEQQRQQVLESQQKEYQNRIRLYSLLAGLSALLLIAVILYRNNRQKHRANQLLNEQKAKVEQTLTTLRTTQTQLIQREKMASLGELTAGIAHEIQNPLNFVNNFSEVSVELLEEQKQALSNGDLDEVGVLADDLTQNLQRITQNGQRASNIVKGMLEHSRTSTGQRQPTDLNTLCEEYLRLAYQGIRAKDSNVNCKLDTQFDASLPLVSVVTSDLSRVLLNLFNNAFYAVGQKQKTESPDYQPMVSVSTTQVSGQIEIRVGDNGMGIPDAIKEKIFQPFFTTKPTGEGTGLGLSLSYDIVTKGHEGTLTVGSREGEFTVFCLALPIYTTIPG